MTTVRKGHPKSRPLPVSSLPMPPHIQRLAATAMLGTLDAPIGATLPAIYLASARAIIRAAVKMQRGESSTDWGDYFSGGAKP